MSNQDKPMEIEDKLINELRAKIPDYDYLLQDTQELLLEACILGYAKGTKDHINLINSTVLNFAIGKVKPKLSGI